MKSRTWISLALHQDPNPELALGRARNQQEQDLVGSLGYLMIVAGVLFVCFISHD